MPFFLAAWTLFFRALIRIHHYRKTLGSVKLNQTVTTNAQMFKYFCEDVNTAWITAIRDAADTPGLHAIPSRPIYGRKKSGNQIQFTDKHFTVDRGAIFLFLFQSSRHCCRVF